MTAVQSRPVRCAILASGRGSNALSILKSQKENMNLYEVPLLITDNNEAAIFNKLNEFSLKAKSFPLEEYPKNGNRRQDHERDILNCLREEKIEWLILAGYRRLLSRNFLSAFYSKDLGHYRVINIHPSLLPAYPGLDSYEKAFEDGVQTSGVTVHFVDAGMDSGPILAQKTFSRYQGDTLESFKERGLKVEHQLYPEVLKKVFRGEYEINGKSEGSHL